MSRPIDLSAQSFEDMRVHGCFLVDKSAFIADWLRSRDTVTLICRPRRFGKTLTLSMVERFLSNAYDKASTEALFSGLDVMCDDEARQVMGAVPVVSLSFASCKGASLSDALVDIRQVIRVAVRQHAYLLESRRIDDEGRRIIRDVSDDMDDGFAARCLGRLCAALSDHWAYDLSYSSTNMTRP